MSTLGEFIRERRQDLGLTQEQLAGRMGEDFRQSDISKLERGRIALPGRERLEALAAALEISLGDLFVHSGWLDEDQRGAAERSPAEDDSPAYTNDVAGLTDKISDLHEVIFVTTDAMAEAEDERDALLDAEAEHDRATG